MSAPARNPEPGTPSPLLSVRDLTKHYPITKGLFQRRHDRRAPREGRGVRGDRASAGGEGAGALGGVHQAAADAGRLGAPAGRGRDPCARALAAGARDDVGATLTPPGIRAH